MELWGTLRQRIGGSTAADADEFVDDFFKKTKEDERWELPTRQQQVDAFVTTQLQDRCRGVALVTSGATIVPLDGGNESFVDLSSRVQEYQGPACVEYLLHLGYAVIFLHREDSLEPFTRHFQKYIKNGAFMDMLRMSGEGHIVLDGLDDAQQLRFQHIMALYKESKDRLLNIPFTSVQQYLMLLKLTTQAINRAKNRGIVILAATVMDFYVPVKEDKLWRNKKNGEFSVNFVRVPNLIRKIRKDWCRKAFLVTFKNQLDPSEMVEAAHADLEKWGVDVVAGTNRWEYPHQILLVSEQEDTIVSCAEDEDVNDAFASSIAEMHRNFRRKREILEKGKQLLLLSAKFSMLKEKDLINEDAEGNKNVKFGKGVKIRADRRVGEQSPVYELKHIIQNKSHCARAHVWESRIPHSDGPDGLDVVVAFSPAGNPETIRDVWGDFWSGWAEKEIDEFKAQMSNVSFSSALDVVTTTISGDYSSASAILQFMWSKIGSAWTEGEQTRIRQSIQNMIAIGLNRGLTEPADISSLEQLMRRPRLQRFDSLVLDQPPVSMHSQPRRRRYDSDEEDESNPARVDKARRVRVHRAVNQYMEDMIKEGLVDAIMEYVKEGAAVHVTGYSMGGMLGQLLMLHLGDRTRMQGLDASKINFVGFGSPRVGDSGFAARLRMLFEPEQMLIVMHPSDTVHAFPPTAEGYADSAIKIFLKEDGLGVGRRSASSFSLLPMTKSADRILESAFKAGWTSGGTDNKCTFCGKTEHLTEQHRCRYCTERGSHRGVDCPNRSKPCSLCNHTNHCTGEHRCKVCQQYGHRGRECHAQRDVGITELVTYFRFHHFLYYNSNLKKSVEFTGN
ncbi:TPA: hypothetical protein N0F65_007175 [Lagenidium giganteum]|uniref:Fungal lipase-like domain-containing protein n=1 Tax=Lagenidium giganteum TaxID=4803 RepID=A0AAV2Z7S5_9STRA|nr:TPA: hypothetical protein N0F65_007175 [Lagenidium giganteum]